LVSLACSAWMRSSWSHRQFVFGPPTLGIVGHSYGALHGARLALTIPATAYVSIDGAWNEWPPIPDWPINTLTVPKLLMGNPSISGALTDNLFNLLPLPKHRLVIPNANHWDFVPPSATTCDEAVNIDPGPCDFYHALAADFTALFLAKYVIPGQSTLPALIDDNLVLPTLQQPLPPEQAFFAGGHLTSFGTIGAHTNCSATLTWTTPAGSGMRSLP